MRVRAKLGRGESRFSKVCRGPGPSRFRRERDPGLALPCLAPFCRAGRPWSLRTLGPTTPRDASSLSLPPSYSLFLFLSGLSLSLSPLPVGTAAQHPLISLAGLLLESSPALILLRPPSDPHRSSSLPVSTPLERPEHSLDSILMECLRGRYLPHCRVCSLVLSHSSRAPLLCWLALRWQPRPCRLW